MKIDDIAKQLANKINQEHYIKHYLEKIQRGAYNKGVKDTQAEQLNLSGVGSSFLNELIEKHKANKKLALDNCKKMKDSNQYPWYDATFNNELLFVFDLEDLKIRSGL